MQLVSDRFPPQPNKIHYPTQSSHTVHTSKVILAKHSPQSIKLCFVMFVHYVKAFSKKCLITEAFFLKMCLQEQHCTHTLSPHLCLIINVTELLQIWLWNLNKILCSINLRAMPCYTLTLEKWHIMSLFFLQVVLIVCSQPTSNNNPTESV